MPNHRTHYMPNYNSNLSGFHSRSFRLHPRYRRMQKGGIRKYRRRQRRSLPYLSGTSFQQELKFFDTIRVADPVSNSGVIQNSLVLIPQGTGEKSRIGRRVFVRWISANWLIKLPAQAALSAVTAVGGDVLRIIVFQDKQANGANTTVLDILETADFDSYRNLANLQRYRIFMDKTIIMNRQVAVNNSTTSTISLPESLRRCTMGMRVNIAIDYDGTAGTIDELQTSNISALYISQAGSVGIKDNKFRVRYDG